MSYIRAKYNGLVRPYMKRETQGFGSLYGGNQVSDVTRIESSQSITNESTSQMFQGSTVLSYTNVNNGNVLVFENQSAFILSSSDATLTSVDTQTAASYVNSSDWLLNESTSTVNSSSNTRSIENENESTLFGDESNAYVVNTGVVERTVPAPAVVMDEEEVNNELPNGRLNENSEGLILSGGWSWSDGALLHTGTSESLLLIPKSEDAQAAQALSFSRHRFRFEVKAGAVELKQGFLGGTDMLNSGSDVGIYEVGVHDVFINPLNWGNPQSVPMYSSTDGTILDNLFLDYEQNN